MPFLLHPHSPHPSVQKNDKHGVMVIVEHVCKIITAAKTYKYYCHLPPSPDRTRLSCQRRRGTKLLFDLQMKSNEGHWQPNTVTHISNPPGQHFNSSLHLDAQTLPSENSGVSHRSSKPPCSDAEVVTVAVSKRARVSRVVYISYASNGHAQTLMSLTKSGRGILIRFTKEL